MPELQGASFDQEVRECDVCVVGGGIAGMCAAIAAARHGASVILIQNRPVLGGNASSEVRMWVCGAHGHNKETGILEEVQLDNTRFNPGGKYTLWDAVLYQKVVAQPHLEVMLNTHVDGGRMDGNRLTEITAVQLTSQIRFTIRAHTFIDCSGDSVLIPITKCAYRQGREARDEFDEDIAPNRADLKTMGNTILLQARETDREQIFTPPPFAFHIDDINDIPNRNLSCNQNFWWIELGGLRDTIRDAEAIRHDLIRAALGVWDFIKNRSPRKDNAAPWALEWVGSLPGKRENRRYVGDHILTQNDIRSEGQFEDTVAYGGWSMDDHHPAGMMYPGKPTLFHPAPPIYGIPLRCLYSRDVENLYCAGRNLSATHVALSSTRVMATCSLLGQAVGTAAAMGRQHDLTPRQIADRRIGELQALLMEDDVMLPERNRPVDPMTQAAAMSCDHGEVEQLREGIDRNPRNRVRGVALPMGEHVEMRFDAPVAVGGARIVFDSNLRNVKRLPCSAPKAGNWNPVPDVMTRAFRIEAERDGRWETVARMDDNHQRLVRLPVEAQASAFRLVPESTYGAELARVFSFELRAEHVDRSPPLPSGPRWRDVVAALPAEDLAAPDNGLE